jgi:hypothetical protein
LISGCPALLSFQRTTWRGWSAPWPQSRPVFSCRPVQRPCQLPILHRNQRRSTPSSSPFLPTTCGSHCFCTTRPLVSQPIASCSRHSSQTAIWLGSRPSDPGPRHCGRDTSLRQSGYAERHRSRAKHRVIPPAQSSLGATLASSHLNSYLGVHSKNFPCTLAPATCNVLAIDQPIPDAPAVTNARNPVGIVMTGRLLLSRRRANAGRAAERGGPIRSKLPAECGRTICCFVVD